jgi:gingipain R
MIMKFYTLLLGIAISAASLHAQDFRLLDAQEDRLLIGHELRETAFSYRSIQQQNWIDFGRSHAVTTLEKAAPCLPRFSESVVIPDRGNAQLVVEYDSYYDIAGARVLPAKGNLKRNVDPESVPYTFGAAYQTDAFFPGTLAKASDPFLVRDVRGLTVTFYPYQYNPVTQVLRVYKNLRVRVVTDKTTLGINESKAAHDAPNNPQLKKMFLNGDPGLKYTPRGESGSMLVICPDAFRDQIQPLVQWKIQKGIPVSVVSTTETGTIDADIKSWLQTYYSTHEDLLYVLLVGDHADIPAHSYGISDNEELWSDSYYAQLAGSDYYPEIFVGRFSGNATQIATMVSRTLEYEKNPSAGNWMTKAIGLGSGEGDGYGDDGEPDWQHLRNIRSKLLNFSYTDVYEFYDGSRGGTDVAGNPNSTLIVPAVNDGIGLFNYCGHGDINLCVTGNFTSSNIANATNNGKYPFVISVACNNGTFTAGSCISEVWLRETNADTPAGAIAACGSSILMAWAQPMQTQDEMAELISEAYPTNRKSTLGGLFYNAQMSMLEKYPDNDGYEVIQTWLFFGDPSVEFRNRETADLTATHVSHIPLSTSALTVNCNVEGALIALTQNDVLIGKGFAAGGQAEISCSALTEEAPLLVTATKQNYRAYQGHVIIGTANTALSVYPNPASALVNIDFLPESAQSQITLTDFSGKVIRTLSVSATEMNHTELSTKGIATGIYQLTITTGSSQYMRKVMIL